MYRVFFFHLPTNKFNKIITEWSITKKPCGNCGVSDYKKNAADLTKARLFLFSVFSHLCGMFALP